MEIGWEAYDPSARLDSGMTRSKLRGSIAIPEAVCSGKRGGLDMMIEFARIPGGPRWDRQSSVGDLMGNVLSLSHTVTTSGQSTALGAPTFRPARTR